MPDIPTSTFRWLSSDDFFKSEAAARIPPVLRVLLTSDGTITTALQALLLTPIGVEIIRQEEVRLDAAAAEFLAVEPGLDALARDVCLTARGRRWVYASSVLLTDGLPRPLLAALRTRRKPLGLLLNESGKPLTRDKLRIAQITNREAARVLGFPEDGSLWARRYRMSLGEKLWADIREFFSPDLPGPVKS